MMIAKPVKMPGSGAMNLKLPKMPNVSSGTTSTNSVVNSRSIKPNATSGLNPSSFDPQNGLSPVTNTLPSTPVLTQIPTGMRHTALTADGKGKRNATQHLPKMTAIPGLPPNNTPGY